MRALAFLLICAACSTQAHAGDISALDVRPVIQSDVDVFDTLTALARAQSDYADGEYLRAAQGFSKLYHQDATLDGVTIGLADSLLAIGDVAHAREVYAALDTQRAQVGRLLIAVLTGSHSDPETALRTALEGAAKDARLWNALGKVLDAKGEGPSARQAYVQAGMCGQRPGLQDNNIGQSFLQEGHYGRAAKHFAKARMTNPEHRLFDNNHRLALILAQDYSSALRALPSDRAGRLLADAGVIADGRGETQLAKLLFEKSLTVNTVYDPRAANYLKINASP